MTADSPKNSRYSPPQNAEDLMKVPCWDRDNSFWYRRFPKGYLMYSLRTGEFHLCRHVSGQITVVPETEIADGMDVTYFRLLVRGEIDEKPDAKLEENGESWVYWTLK